MSPKRNIKSWQSLADPAIVHEISRNLRQMRLNKNISQAELAKVAGLSRITISRLEAGRDVTILTIIQVLRALGKLDILNAFQEDAQISPLQILRMKRKQRKRASGPRKSAKNKLDEKP